MAKKFSINTVVVPAKSRSNGMVLEGSVGSVVVNQIGENKNNASTVVNNYITNNYNTASDTYREISIDDLLALPDESKEIGVLYLVYSGGSADSGWSHDSTFLLNGESYPDGTFVTWNITQWEAVSAEVVNVQNTVKMKPLEKTVYVPTQLSSSASFPRIQEFIKDGIELMRLKAYEKSEEGVYEPKSYVSGNKQTHEYSVVVPYAFKEGETYHGGALRAEDYKKLVEGGDVSFYIDTVIGDNPSDERVPSTKLFVDQLRLMATETVPFIIGGKLWDYYTKSEINTKLGDYVTSSDLSSNYYNKTYLNAVLKALQDSIPTKTSQLTNDSNYATETWVTNKGYVTSTTLTTELDKKADALHYHDCIVNMYSTRPTTPNIQKGDGRLYHFKATSSMTEAKPSNDGHILHLAWDNTNGYDNQLFVPNGANADNTRRMAVRGQSNGVWGGWKYYALMSDIPTSVSQLNNDAGYVGSDTLASELAKKEDKHDYILVTYQYNNVMTVVGFSDAFSSVEATSPISMRVYIKGSTNRGFVHTWFSRHIMRMRQYRQNVSDGNLTYKDDDSVYSVTIDAGGRYVDIGIDGSGILAPSLSGDIVYRQFCFENMGI